MSDQNPERDRLYEQLAIEWELLSKADLAELSRQPDSGGAKSLAALITQHSALSDDDRNGLRWLVEKAIERERGQAQEATDDVSLQETPVSVQKAFLSTLLHGAESDAADGFDTAPNPDERYQRTAFHARGGIGRVWRTHDATLDREVALKELLPERRDREHRKRFLLEARVTGQLEHPGVVPVYDLQTNDAGETFYTMRFIQGKTFRQAIQDFHKSIGDGIATTLDRATLLNAFVAICNTVEYAHSRGIVHRDLKGQNVILGDFGEVIVLDWGLAKLLSEPDAETATDSAAPLSSQTTAMGMVVGTPAFMSPEQALGKNELVGPCSDIYSLGVILYELLTGAIPFSADDVSQLLQKVATESPPLPTTVSPDVARPLEAACLKAMSKDPGDRYPSARELADDIRRYLADEPVQAFREPLMARVNRWGRRHRAIVMSATSVLVVLVISLAIGAGLLAQANQSINTQKTMAQNSATEAQKNADEAQRYFQHALSAVNNYFTVVSENRLLSVPGMIPLRDELLENALGFYSEFVANAQDNAPLKANLADAHYRIAKIRMARGRDDEARHALETSLAIHRELIDEGNADESRPLKYARVIFGFAGLDNKTGDLTKARDSYLKAMKVLKDEQAANPDNAAARQQLAQYMAQYATLQYRTRNLNEALSTMVDAVALSRDLVASTDDNSNYELVLADSLAFQAIVFRDMRNAAGAASAFAEAIEIFERLQDSVHDVAQLQASLSASYHSQGMFLRQTGALEQALAALTKAAEQRRKLIRDFPSIPEYRSALGLSHTSLGVHHWQQGNLSEAMIHYQSALKLQQRLADDFQGVPLYKNDLAASHNNIAIIHRHQENYAEAMRSYEQVIAIRSELLTTSPDDVSISTNLGACYRNVGRLFQAQGNDITTLQWQDKSILHLEELAKRVEDDPRIRFHQCRGHWDRAETLQDLGRFAEAADAWSLTADFDDRGEREFIRMQRARALALSGNHKQAIDQAEVLLSMPDSLDAETKFDAARVFALCIPAGKEDSELSSDEKAALTKSLEQRCVEALKRAAEAGYFDSDDGRRELQEDPDLAAVRERKDFQELLQKHAV